MQADRERALLEEIQALKLENEDLKGELARRTSAESQVARRLEFERIVARISSRFVGECNVDLAIELSLEEMAGLRQARRSYLYLFNEDGKTMENTHEWCAAGVIPQKSLMHTMPLDMFPLGIDTIKKGEIVHIRTSSNLSEAEQKEALESSNIKSLLLIPLRQDENYTGFIGFESSVRSSEWTDDDLSILRVATEVIGSALERRRQEGELKRQMHNISILYDVGKALNFLEDLTRLLNMILDRAIDIAGSQKGSIMFYDEPADELVIRVVRGQEKEMEEKILSGEQQCLRIKNGEGVAGRVFATGEPLIINDASIDPRFKDPLNSYVRSILCVPLNVYDESIGVINIVNKKDGGTYSEDDLHMVMALANQAAVAISNARLYEMAITDSLTRVLIRRHFMQRLETELKRARRYDHSLSLIMADFDLFKEVNDLYGHQAGDYVLA